MTGPGIKPLCGATMPKAPKHYDPKIGQAPDLGYSVRPEHITCERCLQMIRESRNARSATVQRGAGKGKK